MSLNRTGKNNLACSVIYFESKSQYSESVSVVSRFPTSIECSSVTTLVRILAFRQLMPVEYRLRKLEDVGEGARDTCMHAPFQLSPTISIQRYIPHALPPQSNVTISLPDLREGTLANILPGGDVCQQMAKYAIFVNNLYQI